ncbi:hypothetical protein L7F22_019269 [Adiantum nelumboides]|nr:hypothetical protein [Adiantum nelumboides]
MAVSLALNWNLPASTPLFDESSPLHSDQKQGPDVTAAPITDAGSGSSETNSRQTENATVNGIRQPTPNTAGSGTGTKTYAAAASSSQPAFPQIPMPSYSGTANSSQPAYAGTDASPFDGTNTWSGKSQANHAGIPQSFVSEDGRRIRSTSGPQKPSHLTYNDTLQHYPVPLPAAAHSRSVLPPGAMHPTGLPHTASNPSLNSNKVYHPYRRTTKGSDAPQVNSAFTAGRGPPVLPMPGQAAQSSSRIRASSTSSSNTARGEGNASRIPPSAAPITYSSVASGVTKAPAISNATGQLPTSQVYQSPTREVTVNPMDANRPHRERSGSSESFKSANSDIHTRKTSVSSQSSSVDSSINGNAGISNGRSTPVPRKPAPSPLSKGNYNDEDPANSDDENTIGGRTTPTPGDKQKKGLSGKLRKALSLSTLQQVEAAAAAPDRAYGGRTNVMTKRPDGNHYPHASLDTNGSSGSTRSTSPPRTPDNGAPITGSSAASISSRRSTRPPISGGENAPKRSIFNRKFNSSTDNISISSTVSSASMMLRKVGNLGKFARRSNIKGITNMFNKDKDSGKEGLHNDDFGTLPTSSQHDKGQSAQSKLPDTSKRDGLNAKKGSPATASVSHATVELEARNNNNSNDSGMTPAASYVRQHQLQMQIRAENERIAREKAEAERKAMNNANNLSGKAKTTDDMNSSQKTMIEKEKERLKNKRSNKGGWRKRLVGSLGGSSDMQETTGLETMPLEDSMNQQGQVNAIGHSYNLPVGAGGAPSIVSSAGPHSAAASFNETSFDSAFDEDDLEPPHMPVVNEGYESGDDFETDSLRHWGEGIERSRESAAKIKSVKGILKNSTSFNEQMSAQQFGSAGAVEKPFAGRIRANSYDAPQTSTSHQSSVPPMSQISTSTASSDRVDGVAKPSDENTSVMDLVPADERAKLGGATTPTQGSTSSNLGHHANSSMPTLSLMMNPNASSTGQRSMTGSQGRKRLVFADAHIYHSTWPAHVYDRRGELATCNRLTPLLAQRIKEELNTYKMEEMAVAPSSRIHTHFFV